MASEQHVGPWINAFYTYDRWGNLVQVEGNGYLDIYQVQTDSQGIPTNRYASISLENGLYWAQPVYDASGNMTDDGAYLYTYDAAGRLREVRRKDSNEVQQQVWYDHAGRRVKKEQRPAEGWGWLWYYGVWSGERLVVEYQTSVGATFATGTEPEPAAGMDAAADLRYLHWDRLSVRLVTDGNGNPVDTQSHDAYGGELDGGGEAPVFFTSYEREATGLDYARARYYRCDQRRFLSPDRYRGSYRRGDPQTLNRYAYVKNDPVNRIDPSGRDDEEPLVVLRTTATRIVNSDSGGGGNNDPGGGGSSGDNDQIGIEDGSPDEGGGDTTGGGAQPCTFPEFKDLPEEVKNLLGANGADAWARMSDEQKAAFLNITAVMQQVGLPLGGLQVDWGRCQDGLCGILPGRVFFSGAENLYNFLRAPDGPRRRFFYIGGFREDVPRGSLNLKFRDGGSLVDVDIDFFSFPRDVFSAVGHLVQDVARNRGANPFNIYFLLQERGIQPLYDCTPK